MVGKKHEVVWTNRASRSLRVTFEYIQKRSVSNADNFQLQINSVVDKIPSHPEKHPPDKFKKNNNGRFRAFEKYSYRIAYQITEKEIVILRVRHVKQEPQEY
jgi:plasmid stabilization system protein ParE